MKGISGLALVLLCLLLSGFTRQLEPIGEIPSNQLNRQTPEKIALGKQLFFDRRLSGDGTMSCGTCHDPEMGFTDGMDISLSYPTTRNWRNTPTLINVVFQKHMFHDGRAASLEEQALFSVMSAFEMNQNLDFMEEEIRAVPEYLEAFTRVFGDPEVTGERIAMAIAVFQRTLISEDAPLDRFLKGDSDALSAEALQGYQIFTGKGNCLECHHGVTLADDQFHALHVPENPEHLTDPRIAATRRFVAKVSGFTEYRTLDEDPGRYLVTRDDKDWKTFKTPTLREVASTAPYMHNGIFETLDEVIEFLNQGGGAGNSELSPLHLSATEKDHLRVFLEEALSGVPTPFEYPKIP